MPSRRTVIASMAPLVAASGCLGVSPDEEDEAPGEDRTQPPAIPAEPPDPHLGDEIEGDATEPPEDSPPAEPPDPLDDFADLSRWEVIDGTLSRDTDVVWTGNGSARIDVEDEDARAAIQRTLESDIDLSRLHPHLAIRADETCYPRVRLIDGDDDYLEFRTVVRGGLALQPVEFGISAVEGRPDLTDVRTIAFSQYVGSGDAARFWLDDLALSRRYEPGAVMLHFDDSVATDYTEALPILEAHDMAASTFVNPGYLGRTVGGTPRLTTDQLAELADAGWDVGSHTMAHTDLAAADRDRVESEVGDAAAWLVDHGFDRGARYLVYPYANYDQATLEVVRQYHDVAFAGGWPAIGRCRNAALVPRALGDGSFEAAKAVIDRTARFGGISTMFYHELAGDRVRTFERVVRYLADRRDAGAIEVATVSDIQDELLAA